MKRDTLLLFSFLLLALSIGSIPVTAAEKFYSPDSMTKTGLLLKKRLITPKCQTRVEEWGCRISTVVGSGNPGFFRDGVPATEAQLYLPSDVGIGPAGELYIADTGNHRVRKVDLAGTISTVAGNSKATGWGQDGIPATDTRVYKPMGITIDSSGNLYVNDGCNTEIAGYCRIIKVDTAGIASTFAGKPALDDGQSPLEGIATEIPLLPVKDLAIGPSDELYLAQRGRIRKVDKNGFMRIVTETASIGEPWGIAADQLGNIYVSTPESSRINKINREGTISAFAGSVRGSSAYGGPATRERLHYPIGITVDTGGVVYIADYKNHRIFVVQRDGSEMCPLAGTGEPGYSGDGDYSSLATLNGPSDVAVAGDGTIYIADTANHVIRRVTCEHRPYGTLKELPRKVIKPKTIHRYRSLP